LLEEEWNLIQSALIFNFYHPVFFHWPGFRAGFSTNNYPIYTIEAERRNWAKEWFN